MAGTGTDLVALGALRQALREDYFYGVRREVARVLGQTRSAAARDALIEALGDPDPRVREGAAEALGEFHADAVAAGALQQVLEGEKKSYVVAAAAKALGKTRSEGAFEALQAALGRESHVEVIRRGAFEGLGELNDARALPLLLEWSGYGRPPQAREMAIEALGKLGRENQEVFQRLLALLSDPYRWARRAALRALGELGDPRALDPLEALAAAEPERRLQREAELAISKIRRGQATQQTSEELQGALEQLKQEVKTLRKKASPPF
jgi:aminopeptidase N